MAASRRMKGINNDNDPSDSEYEALYEDPVELDHRLEQETERRNLFQEISLKQEIRSMVSTVWIDTSVKLLKVVAYIIVFVGVLGSAVLAKAMLLFITSQLKKGREIPHCNKLLGLDQQFITVHSLEERLTWLWAAWIVFGIPEIAIFLRSARICFCKTTNKPTWLQFLIAFVVETLQTIGIVLLVLIILPEMDIVKGAMLMNAMCLIPGILNLISRDSTYQYYQVKLVLDVVAISAQITVFIIWSIPKNTGMSMLCIPFACLFISLGWWENFINYIPKKSSASLVFLHDLTESLKKTRYYNQRFISLWKILLFLAGILIFLHQQDEDPLTFFTSFDKAFGERVYIAQEVQIVIQDAYEGHIDYALTGGTRPINAVPNSSIWIAVIQCLAGILCYLMSKFACKILIQNFSFTFALNLVGPVTVIALIVFSGLKNGDPCEFHGAIPDYLFFEIPPVYFIWEYINRERAWIWLFWLVSQAWITCHTWEPKCERLAATDKLFWRPYYSGILIDQSLLFYRSKNDETEYSVEDTEDPEDAASDNMKYENTDVKPSDSITRIHICATMWHETKEEMMDFLKSIFRMDEDQSAHRVARKYLKIFTNDYYELETHIFMDDAFEVSDHSSEDSQVNRFVKCLVDCMNDAASEVHVTHVRLRPPMKFPTPYGGKLVWTLPGKTKMICHLKDKSKIRHRKRWSQCMYMYYFLGYRLLDLPISVERKEVIAENTYLLALDGDIDFKPSAVHLLIDLMKKNKNLGAACGRIHPVGSGFLAWYQMFEYAIGHWLQKATEHMIGCVLCSPGCFSLFRGKALMDDNVMKKYTLTSSEARHYVQYDQGEDRWLCTLLLQRGYQVEYSAASHAYTHCPETFKEFFNQRRRWVPSTMANIFDLLADAKRTIKVNDKISMPYIIYQIILMGGSVLGPGTTFLMMVGALNLIMGMSNMTALLWNLVPVAIFIAVCMLCKTDVQLFVANVITCLYALMMMTIIVGLVLQILENGWLAPYSIFTVVLFSTFFITAVLHPQEMNCLLYLLVYYITIPSMYMLLIIYSLCNLNNVSWGTREVSQKKIAKELENDKIEAKEVKKKMEGQTALKWLGNTDEKSGSLECGVAGLFKSMCYTNPKDHKDDLYNIGADETVETPAAARRRSSLGLRRETLGVLNEYEESDLSTEIPKLFVANVITCLYALKMIMIVIVGIVFQILEHRWLAPSSISTFVITAVLHPQEMNCLLYLLVYYTTIPSMYMLLIIYSLCNLNNVSWGTRAQKKTAKELENDTIESKEAKKKMEGQTAQKSGSLECGIASLFECMWYTNPKDHKDDLYLLEIPNTLEKMQKRLDSLGADETVETPAAARRRSSLRLHREPLDVLNEYEKSNLSTKIPKEERDDLVNPYWVEDPEMEKGEVDFLMTDETEFWKDLIDTYLRPIDENKVEQERIKADLKNLRNMIVFAFLMVNTLFVLVILMLQHNQDQLHFKWPMGQKVQISYNDESNMVIINRSYLMLEPIGTLFIVFFGTIMFIQFFAMLMHRFGTLTHLLSTVQLNWYCTKRVEQLSQHAQIENNGIEIVKDLQKLNDEDLQCNKKTSDVARRKTVQNLMKGRDTKSNYGNLDANFKRRLTIVLQDPYQASMLSNLPSLGGNEVTRQATLRALRTRRESVRPGGRSSQNYLYEPKASVMSGRPLTSGAYVNKVYEPAFYSDADMTPLPPRTTVRFRKTI